MDLQNCYLKDWKTAGYIKPTVVKRCVTISCARSMAVYKGFKIHLGKKYFIHLSAGDIHLRGMVIGEKYLLDLFKIVGKYIHMYSGEYTSMCIGNNEMKSNAYVSKDLYQ